MKMMHPTFKLTGLFARTLQRCIKPSAFSKGLFAFMVLPLVLLQLTGCQMTQLTSAARDGDVATINRLLDAGTKVDELPEGKWKATALYWSLFNCKYEAAEFLLKKGANANIPDSYGTSPLDLAVCCKTVKLSFIEQLLQKGADVKYRNVHDGLTGLHYAISCGSADVAKLLINKGAEINTADKKGTTPLILAVQKNSLPVAKLLLEKGADVHLRDKSKKTAMSYTKGFFTTKKDMIQLLQSADGSKPADKTAASIDTSLYYKGIKGIILKNGNVIEGQITSIDDDVLKIRTKDGKILSYSFMNDIEKYVAR